jgi:hypothetical protein
MYLKTELIGGWTGDQLDQLKDSIASGIYEGFVKCMDVICNFVFWGSKIGILCCAIVFIASKDQKAVSTAVKLALIYLITAVVSGQL